ncbi:MAG: EcsC family protein [Bacteroidetes bacterium]|nr:EcsC family protein [Bacteroidota bacterium]
MSERTTLSSYERRALEEIAAWRNPPETFWSRVGSKASESWGAVTDLAHKIPGFDWTLENVVSGVLELTNEITQDSVWTDAVIKDFHGLGYPISGLADIRQLDLEDVDAVLEGLEKKYVGLATVEGAATGLAGAAGIVPDLVALVALNLRAAGETATHCGFDTRDPAERIYALQILDVVASSGNTTRDVTLAPAMRSASRFARTYSTEFIEQVGIGNLVEGIVRRLGMNLTEKKLAQMVPVTGALLGGGLNYLYTTKVCRACHSLYRERFLEAKYGPEVLTSVSGAGS